MCLYGVVWDIGLFVWCSVGYRCYVIEFGEHFLQASGRV